MNEPESMKVLLGPTSTPQAWIVAKSEVVVADCGHECYMAPATKAQIEAHEGPVRTICIPCTGMTSQDIVTGANSGDIRAPQGAHEEVNNHFGFNAIDLMRDRINLQELE